jgi:ribonuclease HII
MSNRTIQEVEQLIKDIYDFENPLIQELMKDERKGIVQILNRWEKKMQLVQREKEKFLEMTVFEAEYRKKGYQLIAGVDEVGRGPLAGPVVAAAVILPSEFYLPGLDDSKKLSERKRDAYFKVVQEQAISIGIGIVEPNDIDNINIYQATKKAMKMAIQSLATPPDVLLIDAMKLGTDFIEESIIKGDTKSISIAAASIVAKVSRDNLMKEYATLYPNYQFQQNMGYGTKDHIAAIEKFGITPIHRRSFSPVKEANTEDIFVLLEK